MRGVDKTIREQPLTIHAVGPQLQLVIYQSDLLHAYKNTPRDERGGGDEHQEGGRDIHTSAHVTTHPPCQRQLPYPWQQLPNTLEQYSEWHTSMSVEQMAERTSIGVGKLRPSYASKNGTASIQIRYLFDVPTRGQKARNKAIDVVRLSFLLVCTCFRKEPSRAARSAVPFSLSRA